MPERPSATASAPAVGGRQGPARPAWPWLQRLRPGTPLAVLLQAGPATHAAESAAADRVAAWSATAGAATGVVSGAVSGVASGTTSTPAIGPALTPSDWPAWCQAHAGRSVRLWLGASLTHELALAPDLALGDDPALLAYARPLLQHYHGEAAAHWPLAAWRCGAGLQAPQRGVSALHGVDLVALQAAAGQAGVRLQAVQPGWSAALALARVPALAVASQAQLLVVEGPLLTQLHTRHGQLLQLQRRRLPQAHWAALQAWWQAQPEQALGPAWAVGHGLLDAPSASTSPAPVPVPAQTPAQAQAAAPGGAAASSLQPLGRWPLAGPDADWLPAAWP